MMSQTLYYYFSDELLDNQVVADISLDLLTNKLNWGTYLERSDDWYIPKIGDKVTRSIVTSIINSTCNASISTADRLNFLQANEGKYVYLIGTYFCPIRNKTYKCVVTCD